MFPILELCINANVLMILIKIQNLLQAASHMFFSFHDKTFRSCHVNILILSIEECHLCIMILKNLYMRKYLVVTRFFSLHEAFWHKSCIMFVLIASGVTYDFVDPLQSTVLIPLGISPKSQILLVLMDLISFSKTSFGFFYLGLLLFLHVTMVTIGSWRTGASFCFLSAPPHVWQ